MSHEYPDGTLAAEQAERSPRIYKYTERDDEPTWIDVILPPASRSDADALCYRQQAPLRESPSYVYAGDSETEETVYLVAPNGELNPSDELVAAVEAVLAKIAIATDNAHSGGSLEDVETDLSNALERHRGRK